ncbi:MAG: tetratricopeptide repeat protein [Planctomycetota bacterium]|nr:tetratricopeptide repeat protein [Planctomycetota bacterium]
MHPRKVKPIPPEGAQPSSHLSRWRAGTLTGVYLLMGLHLAHWKLNGKTLAPLELHEVMYTLELGIVTAGFLFMALALASVLLFGRFFCSWGCHILALEDLCAWLLERLGISPRPIRSRVLVLVAPLALIYMFVWPQVARVLEGRPAPRLRIASDAEGWASFVTTDFWRNLPPVGVALLTFGVCGFLIVYVLGSRSFCRFACPYGALFGLADRVAPGRLVALDGCTGCGSCTATCQSDIRVHEELAAHGTVISSSCLRDLDCLTGCPSTAIAYRFTRPPLLRRIPKSERLPRRSDFSLGEEALLAGAFLASLFCFRGLYGLIPFLMALGLGVILAYLTVITSRLFVREHVKLGRTRLKVAGRPTRAGGVFATIVLPLAIFSAHSGFVRSQQLAGERAARAFDTTASPERAAAAVRHLERVDRWGLLPTPGVVARLGSLHFSSGAPAAAVPWLERALGDSPANLDLRRQLARALSDAGRAGRAEAELERATALAGGLESAEHAAAERALTHELRGALRAERGDARGAIDAYEAALAEEPGRASAHLALSELLAGAERLAEAVAHLRAAALLEPDSAPLHYNLAVLLGQRGEGAEAVEHYRIAARLDPDDAQIHNNLGFLLARLGDAPGAEASLRRALAIAPDFAHPCFNLGRLLLEDGREAEALALLERAARLDERYAALLDAARD